MEQKIITVRDGDYRALREELLSSGAKKMLLVCGTSCQRLAVCRFLETLPLPVVVFDRFQPNPELESVEDGISLFHAEKCDMVFAIGGGSAMDVAKCIKLFAEMDPAENYLKQQIVPNGIPFYAMPTTAGTGSEATRFAVIYDKGVKQSVSDWSGIPSVVVFDPSALKTLPDYQRKCTMLDALCHAVESFWSVNSTDGSKAYAEQAIREVLEKRDAYLANTEAGNAGMLYAANLAGKAINITQTTAGHAMCYKITKLYGAAHGHAAALCVRKLWPWMLANTGRCADPRGEAYLKDTFCRLAEAMGTDTPENAAGKFAALFDALELPVPEMKPGDLEILCGSVNPVRLKNNPVSLNGCMEELYRSILR